MNVLRTISESLRPFWAEKRCHACSQPFLPPHKKICGSTLAAQSTNATANNPLYLETHYFCPQCLLKLQRKTTGYCPFCGEPATFPILPQAPCARCVTHPPPWKNFLFWTDYTSLWQQLLLRLKFHNHIYLAHSIGALLSTIPELSQLGITHIAPVPLHLKRLRARGYNQALEITKGLITHLRNSDGNFTAKLLPEALSRQKFTTPQSGLSRKERFANTADVFSVQCDLKEAHVLLVDDIFTTGATIHAGTNALLRAGIQNVSILVAGRTSLYRRFSQKSGGEASA